MAAAYPEYFYGQLALERLGRPVPPLAATTSTAVPTDAQRATFYATPLAQAVQALASSGHSWQTKRKFYLQLANQAQTETDLLLVSQYASDLGLPELAVVVGRVAPEKGFASFTPVGFPTVATPGRRELDHGPRHRPAGERVRRLPHQPCAARRA
jgi:soluble lytic murein transglycosylase